MTDRRTFLKAAIAATALGAAKSVFAARPARPNIVFILADDAGYGDLSCFGRPDYKTPVLDNLAKEGIKFTDNYAAPVCTPSRVAYHTGRYPHRLEVGLREPLTDANMTLGIPPGHPTVASLLKGNGYATTHIGKWNLGNTVEFGPTTHGFDEFFGFLASASDYYTHKNTSGKVDLWENDKPANKEGYLTDLFTERAVEVIKRKHDKPFFLSLCYNAPHWPWEGPNEKPEDHIGGMQGGGSQPKYAEMMKAMDSGIGKVLAALKAANLDRNTLVVFDSDNGGERWSYNWPFSGMKNSLLEGGIRVPAIARWTGVIPPGRSTNQVSFIFDWSATFLDATGTKDDPKYPFDGVSLLGVCTGEKPVFDRPVFFRTAPRGTVAAMGAMRLGKWKFLIEGTQEHLYDLTVDPGEKADVKAQHADIYASMKAEYDKWNAQMLPNPAAGAGRGGDAAAAGAGRAGRGAAAATPE